MPIRVLFVLLVFVLFTVSSRAAEKPFVINAFAVKSTALPKGSIGVLRHFCFESVQFLAYGSSKALLIYYPFPMTWVFP